MAQLSPSEILSKITNLIKSGNSDTLAKDVREILTDILDSFTPVGSVNPAILNVRWSIKKDNTANIHNLDGDEETPKKSYCYGTNSEGTRGYNPLSNVWYGVQVFTATPVSINQVAFADPNVKTGYGLRYKIGNIWRYGIITTIAAGVATIVGESVNGTIEALEFCEASNIETLIFDCSPKTLQVATSVGFTDETNNGNFKPTKWLSAPAKIVECQAICLDKGTATPAVNLRISGASGDVFSSNIIISANATYYSALVSSNPANNVIDYGKTLDLRVITAVTTAKKVSFFIQIIKNI